ncbi:MAG TPA: CARDB domain-containing protein, partial [Tepidisphaeraceae bacterium]
TLWASTDQTLDGVEGGDFSIITSSKAGTIAPGHSKKVKVKFTSPNIPDNSYFLLAQVDSTNVIAESNEDNNVTPTDTTVQIRQPFVDLSGEVPTPGPITLGGKVKPQKLTVTVHNNGNIPVKSSAHITFVASPDTAFDPNNLDPGDHLLNTFSAKLNLKAGATKGAKGTLIVPADLRSGDYFLIAWIDSVLQVAESDESNNFPASPGKFTLTNPALPPLPVGPDLTALQLSADRVLVNTNELLTFTATVANSDPSVAVEVDETDAAGNVIGKVTDLLDNGDFINSDTTANDGKFNNATAISFSDTSTRYFQAKLVNTGQLSAITPVNGINAPTQESLQALNDSNAAIQQQVTAGIAGGQTPAQALAAAQAALLAQGIAADTIDVSADAIAWKDASGIISVVTTNPLGGTPSRARPLLVSDGGLAAPSLGAGAQDPCKSAIVIDPFLFAQSQNEAGTIIDSFANKGFNIASRRNFVAEQTVTVEDFKRLDRYVGVAIVSDGASLANELTYAADLISNRLTVFNGHLAITPRFIRAYTGKMNKSIVYCDTPFSAAGPFLGDAFTNSGAAAFVGFNANALTDGTGTSAGSLLFFNLLSTPAPGVGVAVANTNISSVVLNGDDTATISGKCDLLSENDLFIQYSWSQTEKDLDSITTFLGDQVGFAAPEAQFNYMTWSGDNTSTGGTETVTIDLAAAFRDGKITAGQTVPVDLRAGWYQPSGGTGPAVLTVALKNKTTGETTQVKQIDIQPGTETGAAEQLVGGLSVTLNSDLDPELSIELNAA